jgi:glutamyl-tRNA synthetase
MHLGHSRTLLVDFLRARARRGRIVMRIEDIDPLREKPGATDAFLRDHEWLGLEWDEGPVLQSARQGRYEAAAARLTAEGRVYPCTCSRLAIRDALTAAPMGPPAGDGGLRYPGTCRQGPSSKERPAALRFRFDEPSAGFEDAIAGPVAEGQTRGDFIVRRADGLFAYHLVVVVDDLAMGITEVVRGRDLLHATPRNLARAAALGAQPPPNAHVPLISAEGGEKLAKRLGSIGVSAYREAGFRPEELIGALAFSLGLLDRPEPCTPSELSRALGPDLDLRALDQASQALPPALEPP